MLNKDQSKAIGDKQMCGGKRAFERFRVGKSESYKGENRAYYVDRLGRKLAPQSAQEPCRGNSPCWLQPVLGDMVSLREADALIDAMLC